MTELKAAAYSIGGDRLAFLYEDVSRVCTLRGTPFEFPDADGTYVQRTGRSGWRYPLRCVFNGADHVAQADDFEALLLRPGFGRLEHPVYGPVDVLPFGDVARSEPLVSEGRVSVVEVTFYDSIKTNYPTTTGGQSAGAVGAVSAYNKKARDRLTSLGGLVKSPEFRAKYSRLLDDTKKGLAKVADYSDKVRTQFDATHTSIVGGVDLLVGDPVTLAAQTVSFIEGAAKAPARILDRLQAYASLAADVFKRGLAVTPVDMALGDLFSSTHAAGQLVSVLAHTFTTKSEAIGAADVIGATMDALTTWRDDSHAATGEVDTGEQFAELQNAAALVTGYLVQLSFTLKQERRTVLDRPRCPVELCAELYGDPDEQLQFFIDSNGLSWAEHLEIPAGRAVVAYV